MITSRAHVLFAAVAAVAVAKAQETATAPRPVYTFDFAYGSSGPQGDFWETYGFGGFRFSWPELGVEIRGQNGILLSDRQAVERLTQRSRDRQDPLRPEPPAPLPRRELGPLELKRRAERLLDALGQGRELSLPPGELAFDAPRLLYFEGGVLVLRHGVEVARCERLWISPLDDRIVIEDAELRWSQQPQAAPTSAGLLASDMDLRPKPGQGPLLVVRGARLTKQGPRWTGRSVTITSCEAGEPHMAALAGELELVEREGQFEVWSRGNRLQVGGASVLPLPDAHFFSADQSGLPLRGVKLGYSGNEGARFELQLGMPYQDVGGAAHEWLTGRPAHEFRGDWNLYLGWIEKRGFPLRADVDYGAKGLYEGRTEAFYMDDDGPNQREILDNLDGSRIDDRNRNLLRTENRVHFGDATNLDVQAFYAGDAAVYSEFFRGDYRTRELPETSVYLHHQADNLLITTTGRFQLDEFSYRSDRALADFYVEELPVATVDWIAQPIGMTPWETPIVLDAGLELGTRRRAVDERSTAGFASDRTFRADQTVELSAPFLLGPIQVRPFAQARATFYDETVAGGNDTRTAFAAGVRAGTRLSRVWSWLDDDGQEQSLRHVVSPIVSWFDRFAVSDDPSSYFKYDATDTLDESSLIRLELRNVVQRTKQRPDAPPVTEDVVFLDLAQDVFTDAQRDNGGDELGLFYYDFLVRSEPRWWPTDKLGLGLYGDQDWQDGLRTLDAELMVGKILGLDWSLDYRRDSVVDAAAGVGVAAQLLGRWDLRGNFSYDLGENEVLRYYAGLRRDDHDWTILIGANYDPYSDEVTFRFEVEPRLFGSGRPRSDGWFGPLGEDRMTPTGF